MRADKRIARTRAFMEDAGLDACIVFSTTDLRWLTGFEHVFDDEQAHMAVLTADTAVIHTDSRYATAMRAAAAEEGLWEVHDAAVPLAQFVAETFAQRGLRTARVGVDAQTSIARYRLLEQALPEACLIVRDGDVQGLRAVKEPGETACMQRAQDIASAAFRAMFEKLHAGMTEAEVSLELEFQMRTRGAEGLAFANIVASGPNSANPHAVAGARVLEEGDLVVFDFGAKVDGYCSDTTRTVSIGAPGALQSRVYDAVRLANETVQGQLRAGVTGRQMHELAEQVLTDAGFAGTMGHALGHGVGLDIHEAPLLSPRYDKPLVPGNVVTVEPGIYLPGRCGARLEDYGVVTDDGYMNFCGLSHELMVVE